nr:hypothetical protein [Kofleriaceae bacterium]
MKAVLAVCVIGAATSVAAADVPSWSSIDKRWPAVHGREQSFSDQLADWAKPFGFDLPSQRAQFAVHAGTHFAMDESVHVADGIARMHTRLYLELGSHALTVPLPDVEMQQDDFRGERIVELRVPLLERRW